MNADYKQANTEELQRDLEILLFNKVFDNKNLFEQHQNFLLSIRNIYSGPIRINMVAKSVYDRVRKEERSNKLEKDQFWFITISPKMTIHLSELVERTNRLMKRSFIKNPIYSYEQTGTDHATKGHHPHLHIICDKIKGITPAQVCKMIHSTFSAENVAKNCIKIVTCPEKWRDDKIAYLEGDKWEVEKLPSLEINKIWRTENNLLSIYKL